MLQNVESRENLRGLYRAKKRTYETKTVHPKLVDDAVAEGWAIDKKNKASVRLRREKSHDVLLEDRVWSLLYRMELACLSKEKGASLVINHKDPDSPETQIDVVGIDNEVALAIECKSSEKLAKRPKFQEELAKHTLVRERFAHAVNTQYPADFKRKPVLAMFLFNISLSENDESRAAQANVVLFDGQDLDYYEKLVLQIGPAAKYQFFADMLPGKTIPGLSIRVPAVRTKMGGAHCYTFSISPEYLLKISYVSHRSKGKASDVDTYQRMLSKSRLNKISQYIADNGIFPTNIVINMERSRLQFEPVEQKKEQSGDQDAGVLGWLDIRPAYKSAWIIDGQHRLFAYSGHPQAPKSKLSVLAFEGLPPSRQAELFIDINAKQKSVSQSLLQELYAELHWGAEKPQIRVRAIVSKAIQDLDVDQESPFYRRIQTADATKDSIRCITLTGLYGAIEKTEFHIAEEKHGQVMRFGPLWGNDNESTLKRTVHILKNWFSVIKEKAPEWWDKGSSEGGGLAMNDSVIACVNILRSIFQHLDASGKKLVNLDNEDLFECVKPYAVALGEHFGAMTDNDKKAFRELRGVQGQTTRTRRCQKAVQERIPNFNPPGLEKFLKEEKAQTNLKAKEIIDRMETTLQKVILEELRRECGPEDSQWWIIGVPKGVRLDVMKHYEEDDGKRGGKEYYFDLIDYKKVALQNWQLFEPLLAFGKKTEKKEKRISWLNFVNEKRNIVAHPTSGVMIPMEELNILQEYEALLNSKISGKQEPDIDVNDNQTIPL